MTPRAPRRLLGLGLALACACARPPLPAPRAPLLVVGLDGGEPRVVETLWRRGELPNLRRVADSGAYLPLDTAYGISPAIWTTIATGVRPSEHGIVDFAVATDDGDLPVSSATRRRPALWNMLTQVHRRVAVLGWWATWPAESVDGVVVSDRIDAAPAAAFSPPALAPRVRRWVDEARAADERFGGNEASELRDRIVARAARDLVARDFDLVLAYFRSADLASHDFWHRFAPEDFPQGPPAGAATSPLADPVTESYLAFDRALGALLDAAPPGTSVMVLSDHGFRAESRHSLQLLLDFDVVLRALGWQALAPDGRVDTAASRAWTHASPTYRQTKLVRFREGLDRGAARRALAIDLRRATFAGGGAAFALRDPGRRRGESEADAVVHVLGENASPALAVDGRELAGAVLHYGRITGDHGAQTRGFLFVTGPIFRAGASGVRVSIHDIAPTILFALGLPVGRDFAGAPATSLFRSEFVATHPLRSIASWGRRDAGPAPASAEDRKLLEELGALGYLR